MTSVTARETPIHLRPAWVGLAVLGGALGTALRAGIGALSPSGNGAPWSTLGINALGAFLLALLLEWLVLTGPDRGWRRGVRIGGGTGLLGGFTTYSALCTDTVVLLAASRTTTALLYAGGTLLGGAAASVLGLLAAHGIASRRAGRPQNSSAEVRR